MKRRIWKLGTLYRLAMDWYESTRASLGAIDERSRWWPFTAEWKNNIFPWLNDFITGKYQFSPVRSYRIDGNQGHSWQYADKMISHLVYKIIKPTFKHIISPFCTHLVGPSAVKGVTAKIKDAIDTGKYKYCMRLDIKSYYASIDRNTLKNLLTGIFLDPIMLKYLHDIVWIAALVKPRKL